MNSEHLFSFFSLINSHLWFAFFILVYICSALVHKHGSSVIIPAWFSFLYALKVNISYFRDFMIEDLLEGLNFAVVRRSGSKLSAVFIMALSLSMFGVFIPLDVDIPGS